MPKDDTLEIDEVQTPEVAALKSGLPVFYGRVLAALERIADAQEETRRRVASLDAKNTRKSDA